MGSNKLIKVSDAYIKSKMLEQVAGGPQVRNTGDTFQVMGKKVERLNVTEASRQPGDSGKKHGTERCLAIIWAPSYSQNWSFHSHSPFSGPSGGSSDTGGDGLGAWGLL